ncbi:MAG: glycosyltransferase, partial [Bacteroidota bacterium]
VSDRSSPDLKLSDFHKFLRFILYKNTDGIICQTHLSMLNISRITKHRNIKVIGNPIRKISKREKYQRENIILNVGRFISSKQQINLIEIFASIEHEGWRLVFIGEGQYLDEARKKVFELGLEDKVTFVGESNNVDEYLNRSKIFAFTSILEGFPNALGEALETPLSCISFNCIAGPSDLIINNYNGFLINNNDFVEYKRKLQILMVNDKLREYFERNSTTKMKEFEINLISNKYYSFLTNEDTAN